EQINGRPWPVESAVRLVVKLARAVHHAHLNGVIHRDLKPANVLLGDDGKPRVTDFGLARHTEDGGGTQSGMVVGTPRYMAPEQAAGKAREVGPAADIHALGAILYELLTGAAPFSGRNLLEVLRSIRDRTPQSLRQGCPHVPPELDRICLRCLAKEPS